MKSMWILAAVVGCGAGLTGCATHKEAAKTAATETVQAAAPTPLSGTVGEQAVEIRAKVEKINHKTREVLLKGPDGKTVKFKAGDNVRNLDQVKVGDEVVATMYESLAWEVKKSGEGQVGVAVAEQAARAKLGEMPAGGVARAVTVTTKITGIDKAAGTVTLEGPEGESQTIKVRNPANLDRVVVGDLVDLTYTEALAIQVERVSGGK